MATQFIRESVRSRLHPFRQAIEELHSRREDGMNNFTNEEPAVERLLNALDFILNTDVEHPGEFFDFIKCALESIPRQALTHLPMEQVLARGKQDDRVENFRLWLIFSLNLTNSLKQSLHATLPMRDVLSCFVHSESILFMDTFIDEFLGTLATLHNPPFADGQTVFKLDAGALQLFQERPIPVYVQPKKRTKGTKQVKGGGARKPREKQTATQEQKDEQSPGGKRKTTLATLPPVRLTDSAVQTDAEETRCETTSTLLPETVTSFTAMQSNAQTSETSTMTDHPSTFMSFQELMEAQAEIEASRSEQKAVSERIKAREVELDELKRDYAERMDIVVSTIRQLKGMYNELFMRSLEAQESLGNLKPEDVDARILDVFQALRKGATSATRERVHEVAAALDEHGGGRKRSGAVAGKNDERSPMPSPRPTAEQELGKKGGSPAPPPLSTTSKTEVMESGSTKRSNTTAGPVINIHAEEDSVSSPMHSHTMVSVENVKLLVVAPSELERPQQMAIQGNRCAGCAASFGDSDDKNLVLKVVQRAGETLRLQKPRRCHYCVRLFCHRCHTNKMAVLPFHVFHSWDFAPQHVCNRDYEFLSKNYDRAFYYLPTLPAELQSRPNIHQAAFLRKKIHLLARILLQCTHESSAQFAKFLHSHYAAREHFYSMADFSKLRSGEGSRLLMAASTPIHAVGSLVAHAGGIVSGNSSAQGSTGANSVSPAPNEDLISFLTVHFMKTLQHVKECRQCVARSSMKCGLCSESSVVSIVDDDSVQCRSCASIYHSSCWDIVSGQCPTCSRR